MKVEVGPGLIRLFCLSFVVFVCEFSFNCNRETQKVSMVERIAIAKKVFDSKSYELQSIIQGIERLKVDGFFVMQTRVNRQDYYGIYDVDGNYIAFKPPYSNIRSMLLRDGGARLSYMKYLRGQIIFYAIKGEGLLYSRMTCEEIRKKYCDSIPVELSVYPEVPQQEQYWMCKIGEYWYIVDEELEHSIYIYERKLAKGLIEGSPKIGQVGADSLDCNQNTTF